MTTTAMVPRRMTDELLADVPGRYRAVVSATEPGIAAGIEAVRELLNDERYGQATVLAENGTHIAANVPILEISGSARQLAAAEDAVLGPLGFAGGIARRCRDVDLRRPDGLRVVCGGWKKLPAALKPLLREGLAAGGVAPRLVDGDFVYVDKNVVTLRGGIRAAVVAARALANGPVAVQVATPQDAFDAVHAGATVVMDDTGQLESLRQIDVALRDNGLRAGVVLAFAGGVRLDELDLARDYGAEVVDLGRAILDAPLWDVHMVVEA